MNATSPIHINSAADVAVAAPYLIGFQPDNELVTLAYCDTRFIVGGTVTLDVAAQYGYAFAVGATLRGRGISQLLLIGYGPERAVTPVMYEAKDACTQLGILIGEALRIDDGQWWSYLTPGTEGTAIDDASPVAAALDATGRAPLASPDAVAAQLAPVTSQRAETMLKAVADAEKSVWQRRRNNADATLIAEAEVLIEQLTGTGTLPTDAETALLGVLLATPQIRIAVLGAAIETIDGAPPARAVTAWCALTRALPDSCRWQAANLTAYAAWRFGDGVLARDAVHLSLSIKDNADNAMGHLMYRILDTGTAPYEVTELSPADFDDLDTTVGP